MRTRSCTALLSALVTLGLAGAAIAQTDVTTSRINGTVRDADGGPLPGVTVEGKNQDTGLVASAVTGTDGGYRLLNLPTGTYTVTAKLAGFKTEERPNVRLLVGSAPTLDFKMQLSGIAETVTVTSEVPVVEVANTSSSTTIQTEQIKALPLNGRNVTDLVLLTPETRRDSERNNISISGQRGINTNVTVDGVDYNNAFFGGTAGTAEGRAPLSISEESVKEFTVITNGASVEFGRSGGGFVNVVTKSGTNTFHGSAFYYWQPQDLVAKFADGRDPSDQSKKQYGASIGGPIMKDRFFFFGSFDKQKQSLTVPISAANLDPDIFAKYPALSSPPSYVQTTDGYVAFGRIDAQITPTQRVLGRLNYATYEGLNGTSSSQNRTESYNGVENMISRSLVLSHSGQFGASALNDLNLNYALEDVPRYDKGLGLPEIQFGGLRFGEVPFLPINPTQTERKAIGDTFTFLTGQHVFKAGGEYNDTSINQVFKGNWRGTFVFDGNSKANFLAGKWTQYYQFGGLNGLTADQAGQANFHQKELSFFLQDQWFVSSNLTVTLGVRWEGLNNPDDPVLNPNDRNADGSFKLNGQIPDDNKQWSPRLGISWAPDSKNVVRLSAGRFWSRTPAILFAQLFTSNGIRGTQYTINAGANGPTDPLAPGWGTNFNPVGVARIDFSRLPSTFKGLGVFTIDLGYRNPYTDRITLGVEREIVRNTGVSLDFTYAKGKNLERLTDINLQYKRDAQGNVVLNTTNGQPLYDTVRPDPFYGRITTYISDAESKYYGLTFSVKKRFSERFGGALSVTWSQDKDNDSNERNFAGIQAEDVNNLDGSYGFANRDQKWKANLNAVWNTPYWGIGVSGSVIYTTGSPYTAVTGNDANLDGFRNDRPTVNGEHFARNSFRQPDFYNVAFRLSKSFDIGPGALSVFGECFNCTNTGNRFFTGNAFTYGTGQTPLAAFSVTNGVGTPRTFQFAARYDF